MNKDQLKVILSTGYDPESWHQVLTEIFGVDTVRKIRFKISVTNDKLAESAWELGSFKTSDNRLVGVYQVDLTDRPRIWQNRVGLRSLLRSVYTNDVDAALVVFVQGDKWRLSLISEIRVLGADGNVTEQKTEPKRYTYLLGKGETVRTPVDRLEEFSRSGRELDALIDAFSVEPLNKAFFKEYKEVFDTLLAEVRRAIKDAETARLFAQRLLNRLMFLYFIQKKGWMTFDGDTNYLRRIFEESKRKKEKFYSDRLYYVFFYGLSNIADSKEIHNQKELEALRGVVPYLNGGLFEPENDGTDEKGKVAIANERFNDILELFERYNFTIDESTPFEVQVAVDPEMLGKVFEELVTGRHESGSYYTPRTVVSFMCREALKHALEGIETPDAIAALVDSNDGEQITDPEKVLDRLRQLKVCDPACGSGAYLLGMLQELLHVREALFASKAVAKDAEYNWKREIIENNIYGVDLDKFATQIAALRLWLSLAIESDDPHPLPNLKYKIGCGDSLLAPIETVGQGDLHRRALIEQFKARKKEYTDADDHLTKQAAETEIERLRVEIAQMFRHLPEPPSPAKLILARNSVEPLQAKVNESVKKGDKDAAKKNQKKLDALLADIAKWEAEQTVDHYDSGNVFDWSVEFAEVFEDGGFDVILANPPYISHDNITNREKLRTRFSTFEPFADIYCYFLEQGIELLKPGGTMAYITSNSYLRADYGKSIRKLLEGNTINWIINLAESQIFQNAIVNVAILIAQRGHAANPSTCRVVTEKYPPGIGFKEYVETYSFASKQTDLGNKSWNLSRPEVSHLRQKIENAGRTLEQRGTKIRLGLATGDNRAFVIDRQKRNELVKADARNERILKPVLRGRDIDRYGYRFSEKYIILSQNGVNVQKDFPAIFAYFDSLGTQFKTRGAQGRHWSNLRACSFFEDFKEEKIVWIELTDRGRFAICSEEIYLLNSAYFLLPPDGISATFLVGILNSRLITFYLTQIAETSGMGVSRWINNYVKEFPIPDSNPPLRSSIEALVEEVLSQKSANASVDTSTLEREIDQLVYQLFDLTSDDIAIVEGRYPSGS